MNEQIIHHWPPELLALLVDAIPRLHKGKQRVLDFFKGCGVKPALYADIQQIIRQNPTDINMFEIVRQILIRLNDEGDTALVQRREIVKRVAQWDDFSSCYDNWRTEAEGFVAKIQKLVDIKDSFTRMNQEREKLELEARQKRSAEMAERERLREERTQIKSDLYTLFGESDAKKRGIALEGLLNRLFNSYGILVRESFRRVGNAGEGVIEQIDGVIEFDGEVYLVEMKWWSAPLGVGEVAQHLVRVFNRHAARGILISQSGYTDPAVTTCRESLAKSVFVLAKLEEIVFMLEREESLTKLLKAKVEAAIVDKNPFIQPLKASAI